MLTKTPNKLFLTFPVFCGSLFMQSKENYFFKSLNRKVTYNFPFLIGNNIRINLLKLRLNINKKLFF